MNITGCSIAKKGVGRPGVPWFSRTMVLLGLCVSAQSQPAETANKAPATTQPAQASATAEYMVGPGDVLRIDVWQEPEISGTAVVRPDGNISLPLVNEVKVNGATPLQIQDTIAQLLKKLVKDPKVTVTVSEIHSKRAFITGEVTRPGEYALNSQITVLQLIAQAGGFTPFAKTERILVLRTVNGAQQRLGFNYKEVVRGVKTEQNINLQSGDTVVVP